MDAQDQMPSITGIGRPRFLDYTLCDVARVRLWITEVYVTNREQERYMMDMPPPPQLVVS